MEKYIGFILLKLIMYVYKLKCSKSKCFLATLTLDIGDELIIN